MRPLFTLLSLVTFLCCFHAQAGSPGLLENHQSEFVVLTHDAYSAETSTVLDKEPTIRPVEAFTYGLIAGLNLYSFSWGLNLNSGKNRFEDQDNTKKDADIGLTSNFYYERMLCHAFALGAFVSYASSFNLNRVSDGRYVEHLLLMGIVGTYYWGFGELNRGGIMAAMLFGVGFSTWKSKLSDNDAVKGPKSPLISTALNVGGWVMATRCLMFYAYIGLMSYQVEFMNMEEGESSPDMTIHNFDFGVSSWSPTLGLRFICGGKGQHREARRNSIKSNLVMMD